MAMTAELSKQAKLRFVQRPTAHHKPTRPGLLVVRLKPSMSRSGNNGARISLAIRLTYRFIGGM